ncbi:RNA polymerase sigma factor [Devosia sp.]|uniref:RNA polymerase sigma factor n=1 Tax=Devosia sp. TaxID=1871048 RepID=UPI0032677E18
MTTSSAHNAIETVWRIEAPRLVAGLTRMVRDISLAEELAQDALLVALRQWPDIGVPTNPGAWLMTTAKRRAIDYFRRNTMVARKLVEVAHDLETDGQAPDPAERLDDDVGDDLLNLMFVSCHPVLSREARCALTLRLIGGLTTDEIARAFLVPEPTMAQRIVRAKKSLSEAGVKFETPLGDERHQRVGSVLEVLYLIFNEGYSATVGQDLMRPQLCEDAIRMGRILARLAPAEPEVHGLLALMEIQASRQFARVDARGEPILLLDQNRGAWDRVLINRGLDGLAHAEQLGGAKGYYALQAAIAACHARATRPEHTDWARIAALYGELAEIAPSPIIELNRAVAISMAFGPQAGLDHADTLRAEPALKTYHLLATVRGDLLEKLGRKAEAGQEFERAAGLTRNERERALLRARAAAALR